MLGKIIEYCSKSSIPIKDDIPLISNYSDIEKIIKLKVENKYEYFYNNRNRISHVLYEEDKFIVVKNNNQEELLSNLFFLILLIKAEEEVTNYIYDFKFIENINNLRKNCTNKLTALIISMLIIDLIKNYRGASINYDDIYEKDLSRINDENIKIRDGFKFKNEFNIKLNTKAIKSNNVEELYLNLIISLIENEKINDYEFAINIFEQLELKTINITKTMYNKLKEIFDYKNNFIQKYMISKFEDLLDEKKINFYYIILNYIFKNSFYIYNIPFLLDTQKTLIKIIKSDSAKLLELLEEKNDKIKSRLKYNIKFICDFEYYNIEYFNGAFGTLKELNDNNKESYIETKEFFFDESNDYCKLEQIQNKANSSLKPEVRYSQENKNNFENENEKSIINSQILSIDKPKTQNINNNYLNDDKSYVDYSFLEYEEIIGCHKPSADFIQSVDENYFISGGGNKILSLYDENYKKLRDINLYENISYVSELKTGLSYNKIKRDINIIACLEKEISLITINKEDLDDRIEKYNMLNITPFFIIDSRRNNHYIVCGKKGIYYFGDLFSSMATIRENILYSKAYRGGIHLNKFNIAFTSNKIITNGEDKLIILNLKSITIIKIIEGYSFILSSNGLSLIPREETQSNNKILLCACKKYLSNQKNGILLVNAQVDDNKDIKKPFYDTGSFEVYCICPILRIAAKEKISIFKENINIYDTDYFLAGGFDSSKNKGIIRLYKLVRSDKIEDTTIEFIQNIDFEKELKFKGFKKPISCMKQSKKNGKILITSWDGNVYSFSYPKIEQFLDYDEQMKYDGFLFIKNKDENIIQAEA